MRGFAISNSVGDYELTGIDFDAANAAVGGKLHVRVTVTYHQACGRINIGMITKDFEKHAVAGLASGVGIGQGRAVIYAVDTSAMAAYLLAHVHMHIAEVCFRHQPFAYPALIGYNEDMRH